MSKLFFDNLIVFEEVEGKIDSIAKTEEERGELWEIVDNLIHHRALGLILDKLPKPYHTEFLEKFHLAPHDDALMDYLKEKIGENIEELLRQELGNLAYELLEEFASAKK